MSENEKKLRAEAQTNLDESKLFIVVTIDPTSDGVECVTNLKETSVSRILKDTIISLLNRQKDA